MNVGMNVAADSIGRTLARLSHRPSRKPPQDTSREAIAALVTQAEAPLSVEDLAEATNLHINTVRTHLDVLRAAGRVERVQEESQGRGRPKWLYRATGGDDLQHRLATELTQALQGAHDPLLAEQAASLWRKAQNVSQQTAGTPDEAVAVVAQALAALGFDVDVSPVGDAVYLGQCPYAALVADHPVICDIHAKALEQVLAGTGQDIELESMDVFPRPGVCVAHLRRPDVVPARVVSGSGEGSRLSPQPTSKRSKSKSKKQSKRRTA
jgi:predicted ArsR family transcriptional regulator